MCSIQSSPSPCTELTCSETAQASSLNICPCFPSSLPGTLVWGSRPCLPLPDRSVPGSPGHPHILAHCFPNETVSEHPLPSPHRSILPSASRTVTGRSHLHPIRYTSRIYAAVATCLLARMETPSRQEFGCLLPALFPAPGTFMARGKFPGKTEE